MKYANVTKCCSKLCAARLRGGNQTENYWAKVAKGDCWLWTASIDEGGYGRFVWNKRGRMAHHVSWELAHGQIPSGLLVLHRCDVRHCVNPDHLFLGTQRDNMQDMLAKGRGNPSRGSRNGSSKLTEAEVAIIRTATGSQQSIADEFHVSQCLVSQIKRGVAWKHTQ